MVPNIKISHRLKILVVEDEDLLIDVLENKFRKWGWECIGANSVPQALSVLEENFDVVITDIRMPRLTGLDLLKSIKELYPDLEVILMSAYEDMEVAVNSIELGAFSFLQKPLDLEKLRKTVLKAARIKLAKKQINNYHQKLEKEVESRTEELKRSKDRYQKVVQLAPACIWTADLNGNFTTMESEQWAELIGYTVEEMKNSNLYDTPWQTKESKRTNKEALNEVFKGKFVRGVEEPIKKKSGEIVHVAHNLAPLYENGEIIGCIGVTTDITDRKEAQEHLKMLAQTIRSVNYCISISDMDGNIIFINNAFTKTYGYEKQEILGKDSRILWKDACDEEEVKEIINSTLQGRWEGETINRKKGGTTFPVNCSTSLIKNDNGEAIAYVIVSNDITEFKALQKEIIHSEKLIAAGKIAAGIAHELRNQVAAMSTSAQFCLDNLELSPQLKKHLKRIDSNLDSATEVLQKLLNFARPTETQFSETNINQIINDVINLTEAKFDQKKIRVEKQLEENLPIIFADHSRLRDLIMNLLLNAFEASNSKSSIRVETSIDRKNDQVLMKIRDEGSGIPETEIDSIFEPFVTTKSTGTGLGLSICQQIIDEHNGEISVKNNKKGSGCTFKIKLPTKMNNSHEGNYKHLNEVNYQRQI